MSIRSTFWCGLVAAVTVLAVAAQAQHTPEFTPRPGEQRLSRFQWRATHNSFQRYEAGHWGEPAHRIPMSSQISYHGVRLLELDLTFHQQNQEIWVRHHCADAEGERSYESAMDEIEATPGLEDTFTFVYFNSHNFSQCPGLDALPNDWRLTVAQDLLDRFGSWIYTSAELRMASGDNHNWPSVQELIRRDKHLAFFCDGYEQMNFFFDYDTGALQTNPPIAPEWYNTDDENDSQGFSDTTFTRTYPAQFSCGAESFYETAMNNEFNFVATNCLDQHDAHTDGRLHPPFPMYATPLPTAQPQWGTRGAPYFGGAGLDLADQRAADHQAFRGPSKIDVKMAPGTYGGMHGRVLAGPIVLKPAGPGASVLTP